MRFSVAWLPISCSLFASVRMQMPWTPAHSARLVAGEYHVYVLTRAGRSVSTPAMPIVGGVDVEYVAVHDGARVGHAVP